MPASANLAETAAFMDDLKRILVFSEAGGTGRSYHAELSARNRRLRVHYLLEPGWKADAAIQGLGRTNRTNQAQPPLFRPIATDVKAEKRFLSTIARRLDTLGAITRGQRQTGGQGLFRPEDNLEFHYARDALRQLYLLLVRGKVEGCSLQMFEDATGLKLMDANGIKDELPPITTFLNRLLALTIDLQGVLFTAFEQLLNAKVEGAIASGVYDVGLETLQAESFVVTDRRTIYTHPATGAETRLLTITERRRNRPVTLDEALDHLADPRAVLLVNERSGRAAVQIPAPSLMLDDGEIERRVRLIRPMEHHHASLKMMDESHWHAAEREAFAATWAREVADVPEFADSTLHIVAGLLLPIWKRLPNELSRVYRLQTDEGERIIGRRVSPAWAANASVTGTTDPDAGCGLRGADRGPHRSRPRRRPAAPSRRGSWAPTASSCRASPTRCATGCAPTASSARSSPGSCACSCRPTPPAPPCWRRCWATIRRCASANGRRRDAARRLRTRTVVSRAMPRRCAGTTSPPDAAKAAIGWWATSATRPAARCSSGSRNAEGPGRKMDRRRHRRTWRSARRDPGKLRPDRLQGCRRRGAFVPEPAASRA